jgi:hypothetical protein
MLTSTTTTAIAIFTALQFAATHAVPSGLLKRRSNAFPSAGFKTPPAVVPEGHKYSVLGGVKEGFEVTAPLTAVLPSIVFEFGIRPLQFR